MHSSNLKLYLIILLIGLLSSTSLSPFDQESQKLDMEKYTISLISREFIPKEGIDDKTLSRLHDLIIKKKIIPHIIIQFYDNPSIKQRQRIETKGIQLLSYTKGEAWFASLSNPDVLRFKEGKFKDEEPVLSLIRWIGEILPEDKIHPYLIEKGPGKWAKRSDGKIKLSVDFFKDVSRDGARKILKRYSAEVESESTRRVGFFIVINPDQQSHLAREDKVKSIEMYPPPKKKSNDGSRAWTNTDAVQNLGLNGDGVILGIWDENEVDAAHNDLGARVTFGEISRTNITSGHSTHVAGTMAGNGSVALILRGHAPNVEEIVSFDYLGYVPAEMENAIADFGIVASNNSWNSRIGWEFLGGRWIFWDNQDLFGDYLSVCYDFDDLVMKDKLIIVFSIGNDRSDPADPAVVTPSLPADWDQGTGNNGYSTVAPTSTGKNIITVGAIDDATGNMSSFSNWGPTDDGRIKPDLVAPGVNIISCADDGNGPAPGDINNAYYRTSGTSMAAPAVTGISALIIHSYRATSLGDADSIEVPMPSTVKAILIHSAQDLGNPGPDFRFGWGGVDAQAAAEIIENHLFIEDKIDLTENDENIYQCFVPDNQAEFRITLVWDDIPARYLINDLDLLLQSPDGDFIHPWVLDPDNPANRATTGIDNTNNVEQVVVENPDSGLWKIRVRGYKLKKYPEQSYSLVSDFKIGPVKSKFEYAVKMICGVKSDASKWGVAQGMYATTVNVHNPNKAIVRFFKKLALTFPPGGQGTGAVMPISFDALGPDQALATNFNDIQKRLFPGGMPATYIEGFIVVQSSMSLDVTATYSVSDISGGIRSIDIEQIYERKTEHSKPKLPDLIVAPFSDGSFCQKLFIAGVLTPSFSGKIVAKVRNIGSESCGPFVVRLGSLGFPMYPSYTVTVSGLVKDEEKEVTFYISMNEGVHTNDRRLITVDINNDVIESNEDNNSESGLCVRVERDQ